MAEPEDELAKYKRLYEEQKARVKELERQNLKLKDAVQQLMAAGRQQVANKGAGSGATSVPTSTGGDFSSGGLRGNRVRTGGGGGAGGSSGGCSGGGSGVRGRGNAVATNQRASQPGGSSAGGEQRQDDQSAGSTPSVGGAAGTATAVPPEPPEPDVRSDIVAQMREASMGKDAKKLEAAIKMAEDAGLHFEAKQGRRQLARIKA